MDYLTHPVELLRHSDGPLWTNLHQLLDIETALSQMLGRAGDQVAKMSEERAHLRKRLAQMSGNAAVDRACAAFKNATEQGSPIFQAMREAIEAARKEDQ